MYVVVFLKRRKREAFPLFPVIVGLCRILSAANPVKLVDELFADTRNGRKKNWTAKFSGEEGFPAQRENHSAPKLESSWRECVYHLPMNIQYSHQWIQLARKVPFK